MSARADLPLSAAADPLAGRRQAQRDARLAQAMRDARRHAAREPRCRELSDPEPLED